MSPQQALNNLNSAAREARLNATDHETLRTSAIVLQQLINDQPQPAEASQIERPEAEQREDAAEREVIPEQPTEDSAPEADVTNGAAEDQDGSQSDNE
jgi:hypothetical protein